MLLRHVHALSAGAALRVVVAPRDSSLWYPSAVPTTGAALSMGRRALHMPPGGFDEPLPPTFGRQQGKGELSHTNLRKRRQKRRLLQSQRRRLPLGALKQRTPQASLTKIKQELLALGERSTQALKGPPQPSISIVKGLTPEADSFGHDDADTAIDATRGVAPSPVAGSTAYVHRLDATEVAHGVVDELANTEDEDDQSSGRSESRSAARSLGSAGVHDLGHANARRPKGTGTLLDHTASVSEKANAHSEVFALTEAASSGVVPGAAEAGGLDTQPLEPGSGDRSPEGLVASAVASHWQDYREADAAADAAAMAMERRFAVSPRSSVLGSDLDRLEHDMLRDHHQHLARQPPLDGVYAQFGGGRRGKRMLWEPSSSFDKLNRKDFAANRASERTLGDAENRNLSPYHMYAEAYREAQHDARKAQLQQHQQSQREAGKGINYTRTLRNRLGEESLDDHESLEAAMRVDDTQDSIERAAEENPHFPLATENEAAAQASARPRADAGRGAFDDDASQSRDRLIIVDARRDYKPQLVVQAPAVGTDSAHLMQSHSAAESAADEDNGVIYDAYRQRPADTRLVAMRGPDYWDDPEHRRDIEERAQLRHAAFALEKLQQGAMDTSEIEYSVNKVRKETFLYFQAHPINEMIQEPFVRIRRVLPKGGAEGIYYDPFDPYEGTVDLSAPATTAAAAIASGATVSPAGISPDSADEHTPTSAVQKATTDEDSASLRFHMDVDIPVQDARRMAQELGLDLIRIGAIHSQKSDRRIVALCMLADHREHMRDMIKFKIQKLGVQPPPTKACIEVPFTGGIHPHAIRFKAVGIAKHLLHRHAIRLNLTKFGTPREGFPVFQSILDEVKRQCLRLKAYHKAGEIQADYNEIYCYLYPSTGRSPKTTVDHPTPAQVRAVQDFRILENEKEVYFDDLMAKVSARERLTYLTKLENGTAWAEKDEGMSLQRQRALKVMLGYLPKGNNELYSARGDVNIPAPFRSSHPTSVSAWSSTQESNLEQASRGAAALGKRASMAISEMHDLGETPENPTQLDRFYYRVQGPALEVGEFKEALGLKDNRRKKPALAPGFATLGMRNGGRPEQPGWEATK